MSELFLKLSQNNVVHSDFWFYMYLLILIIMLWHNLQGATQQSFVWRGSTPKSKILLFYIPFLTEQVFLLNTFHGKL